MWGFLLGFGTATLLAAKSSKFPETVKTVADRVSRKVQSRALDAQRDLARAIEDWEDIVAEARHAFSHEPSEKDK